VVSSRFARDAAWVASSAAATQSLITCTVKPRSVACRAVCSTSEVGGDPGEEPGADPPGRQLAGQPVPGQAGQFLVVHHQIGLPGQLRDQRGARRVRAERLLRLADGPHEGGVADEPALAVGDGEAGEDQRQPGGHGRTVATGRALDDTAAGDRPAQHRAEEAFRLDDVDLPVQREHGSPVTRHDRRSCLT
jgi:hypothetical protein